MTDSHDRPTPIEGVGPQHLIAAAALIKNGRVFDLDCGRWPGMPVWDAHAPLQVLAYRTPHGLAVQSDQDWLQTGNDVNFAWNSELVIGSMHTGTHIDALSHVTCGPDSHWYGGIKASDAVGDFGPTRDDAWAMPPVFTRGILIDVAGAQGRAALDAGTAITREDLERVLEQQGTEVRPGDVVLVRTGYLSVWPDREAMARHDGAGLTLDAASFLADAGAVAIGADNESLEQEPSSVDGNPLPVHLELLIERGVFILELVLLEELSSARAYEFAFVCLPLKIRGATGSMVRPIAIT